MSEQAYTWDQVVQAPNENDAQPVFPKGVYRFTITKFERSFHQPKKEGKLPPCPKGIVTVKVDGGNGEESYLKNNIFLHPSCDGLTCAFLNCIGLRKHGDPLDIRLLNANTLLGRGGSVLLSVSQYKEKDRNEIDRFLDPDEVAKAATPTPTPTPPQPVAAPVSVPAQPFTNEQGEDLF